MRDDDYEMQVESEASQYIPFAIEEVNLDFQILGPSAVVARRTSTCCWPRRARKRSMTGWWWPKWRASSR